MPMLETAAGTLHYGYNRAGLKTGGPALVLVHGAGGNYMHWPGDLRRLPDRPVYALDLPGHGKSPGPGLDTVAGYAEVVHCFAARLGLGPFVLGGHSMGGAIALEFALRYPGRLAGLVLVGTGARLRVAPQILQGVLSDFAATADLLAEWTHAADVEPNLRRLYRRRLAEVSPEVLHGDFLACDAFDRRPDVASINTPALVICGDADRMTPPKFSQSLHDQLVRSSLVTVPGAGHMAMLEQPAVVAQAVQGWLNDAGVVRGG